MMARLGMMRNRLRGTVFAGLVLIGGLMLSAGGCASWVNIPPEEGDTAIHAVNLPPVPGVMASAVSYAVEQYPAKGTIAVALPAPASERCFAVVLDRVGKRAMAWGGGKGLRSAYRVLSVRIRGNSASVDVLLPTSVGLLDGKYLLEVNLAGQLDGWSVRSARRLFLTTARLEEAARPMGTDEAAHGEEEGDAHHEDVESVAVPASDETMTIKAESGTNPDQSNAVVEEPVDSPTKPLHPIVPAKKKTMNDGDHRAVMKQVLSVM